MLQASPALSDNDVSPAAAGAMGDAIVTGDLTKTCGEIAFLDHLKPPVERGKGAVHTSHFRHTFAPHLLQFDHSPATSLSYATSMSRCATDRYTLSRRTFRPSMRNAVTPGWNAHHA
jgi:hypothetical protein